MMILLDTDTLSLLMRNHPTVTRRVADSEPVAITVVTRLEILKGRIASVLKAADGKQLLQAQYWFRESEAFLERLPCLGFDSAAADVFDRLRETKRLRRIGLADLLIASIAVTQRATLITRNLKHFAQISELQIENWAED